MLVRFEGKYVFVRHKLRQTWELPAGHIEEGETPYQAACRELFEETGAKKFKIEYLFDYSVTIEGKTGCGRFYQATISEIGPLPDSEIAEIKFNDNIPENLTYPEIQMFLVEKAIKRVVPPKGETTR